MPNWVECDLNVTGTEHDLDLFLDKILLKKDQDESFDFNAIVPRPEALNITSGGSLETAYDIIYENRDWFRDDLDMDAKSFVLPTFALERLADKPETVIQNLQRYFFACCKGIKSQKEIDEYIKTALDGADQYKSNVDNYGHKTWYSWSVVNWGTKWNACDFHHKRVALKNSFQEKMFFTTAWSPPIPVIERAGEMFPQLRFNLKYYEGAMGFKGILNTAKGRVTKCSTGNYRGSRGG